MSTEQDRAEKKRKRKSKTTESHTPSRKRSKPDLADAQSPLASGGEVQKLPEQEILVNGGRALELLPASKEAWGISAPIGGRFLNAPPIFSKDEKYLLLSASRAIHIYECSSSLLVRKLPLPNFDTSVISAYALSSASPNHVYAGTKTGSIYLWDWTLGNKLGHWNIESRIREFAIGSLNQNSRDLLYTSEVPFDGEETAVKVYELNEPTDADEASSFSSAVIATHKGRINSLQIHLDGKVAVLGLERSVLIGERHALEKWALDELVYTWRELELTSKVTSFDIRIRPGSSSWKHDFSRREAPRVDVAIGRTQGEITVYEDVLAKLIRFEQQPSAPEQRLPRQFHWHRRPVSSVRWSRDGAYLISGGQEMSLVLWQMSTGKRNLLPYLMAAITQVVVSPSGAAYAVQLEDNSIIVLSTTELEAKTSIAGVQTHFLDPEVFEEGVADEVDGNLWQALPAYLSTPATIDPLRPTQILAAVPSSVVKDSKEPGAPYLQRFDISTGRHVYRQALTRNNAIHVNESPDGTLLSEPNITHLQISQDGNWLATIEDWTPPKADLEHLDFGMESVMQERDTRREIYLKFWRRNVDNDTWALDTRIDTPHLRPDGSPGRIFSLIADPSSVGFATLGDDGYIRIWKPKSRLEDGRFVRGAESKSKIVVIWSAQHSICLEHAIQELDADLPPWKQYASTFACMTYSDDGSVLAVSQQLPDDQAQGVVHLINAAEGHVQRSTAGLWETQLATMGFLDRYLIIASDALHVWDLVLDKLVYSLTLGEGSLSRWPRLATNSEDGTFALALPQENEDGSVSLNSRILVFKPTSPDFLASETISNVVVALIPARGSPGYVVLDSAAEIRTLSPQSGAAIPLLAQLAAAEGDLTLINGQEVEADSDEESDEEPEEEDEKIDDEIQVDEDIDMDGEMDEEENDRPVVRPDQLAAVFDVGPSFALPPVQDLFNAVVGLYAKKTRTQPDVEML